VPGEHVIDGQLGEPSGAEREPGGDAGAPGTGLLDDLLGVAERVGDGLPRAVDAAEIAEERADVLALLTGEIGRQTAAPFGRIGSLAPSGGLY
jgi:hypothetical protein